ncbi:MAG: YajD family HNH nuclease [Rhodocyclaceae bacterium]
MVNQAKVGAGGTASAGPAANRGTASADKLDKIVAEARRAAEQRDQGYREQALKIYPWVCGRCARSFTHANLRELTVHHRDHNHDNNPPNGSNWELLCLYCHDNEHQRLLEASGGIAEIGSKNGSATHSPFADLKALLGKKP